MSQATTPRLCCLLCVRAVRFSPGQDLRPTQPLGKIKYQVLQIQHKASKVHSPSRWTAAGARSEGFILLLLFFTKVSQIWGEGGWAEYQLEIQAQLCHTSTGPHFAAGCPPAIPTQPTAGKSTCLSRKNTHTQRVCCSVCLPLAFLVNTPKRPGSTPGMGRCQHSSASLALTHSVTHLETLSSTGALPLAFYRMVFLKKGELKKTLLKYVNDIE